jgi:hypothetical protein
MAVWINSMREAASGKAGNCLYRTLRDSESLQRRCCRFKSSGILRYVLWQKVLDVSNDRNAVIFNGKECLTLKVKALRSFNTAQQTHCPICTGHAVTIFFRTNQTVKYNVYYSVHCSTELAAESFWEANSSQLVQKFPACYGTWRFITVFTTARHYLLSWARLIQSTPYLSNF